MSNNPVVPKPPSIDVWDRGKGKTRPPEILERDEVKALIAGCPRRTFSGIRCRAMIVLLWAGLLRSCELRALREQDVTPDGIVTIRMGKGGKYRRVALSSWGMVFWNDYLKAKREKGLNTAIAFCSNSGRPLIRTKIPALLESARVRAKLGRDRVNAHGLRHSGAVEMARNGIPVPIISKALGHANIRTTQIYLDHFCPKEVIAAMQGMNW